MKRLIAAAVLSLLAAAPAHAADKRMVSYDSASAEARRLTGAGLTFVFTKSMMRTRVLAVHATAVPVGVVLEPAPGMERKLDPLMGEAAGSGALYEIRPDEKQGPVMVQAFCPGSTKGWLAIGPIAHARPLRVHAFGDDPRTGEPRLCGVMEFDYRGEWRLPRTNSDDPTDYVFSPNWQ
ncbi:MAG TPA: hypothetical protein VF138_04015 [Caulobacteraceae bacterium]